MNQLIGKTIADVKFEEVEGGSYIALFAKDAEGRQTVFAAIATTVGTPGKLKLTTFDYEALAPQVVSETVEATS